MLYIAGSVSMEFHGGSVIVVMLEAWVEVAGGGAVGIGVTLNEDRPTVEVGIGTTLNEDSTTAGQRKHNDS